MNILFIDNDYKNIAFLLKICIIKCPKTWSIFVTSLRKKKHVFFCCYRVYCRVIKKHKFRFLSSVKKTCYAVVEDKFKFGVFHAGKNNPIYYQILIKTPHIF